MKALILILCLVGIAFPLNVILDPGHGGTDPGATGPSYTEKQAALDVGLYARDYLELAGVTVGMTRSTDITLSLADRTAIANSGGWERFMSIHENAFNSAVQGTETFCYPTGSSNSFDLRNKIQPELIWAHGYNDRGVKTANFHVLRETTMPAILGEGTFIDYTAGWNESYRYLTNWNDHSGRQGFAYAKGYSIHRGITPPVYGEAPPETDSIIVDNLDVPEFTSSSGWISGSFAGGWDGCYLWTSVTGDKWARWTPNLPEDGEYDVYMWWLAGANRCDDIFVRVNGVNNDSMLVSQKGTGSGWHHLGTFGFYEGTGGYVSLGDRTATNGDVVIADAVLWIYSGMLLDVEETPKPDEVAIYAYPNPFNSACRINADNSEKIEIYDIRGKIVATLDGGNQIWSPEAVVSSGIYNIRAYGSDGDIVTKRIVYLK